MAIIANKDTKVLVQGITGTVGSMATRLMLEYGTEVLAGVTPGKGGQDVEGVPVYNSVKEALAKHPDINLASVFVPPFAAVGAIKESIDNGIPTINCITEGIAITDATYIIAYAKQKGSRIIGPSSIGIMSPGECRIGTIGGTKEFIDKIYKKGEVGIISKSGGMTNETAWAVRRAGFGQSTVIGIGGDVISGTDFADLLLDFENDEETKTVVMFTEPGGKSEESVIELIESGKYTKPLVAYVSGFFMEKMLQGVRFGHAGTFIESKKDKPSYKKGALRAAGVIVADYYEDVGELVKQSLK